MIDVLTVSVMRERDLYTIKTKVDSKELMYRAALGVYNSYKWSGKIGIFCGSGNNAGDGYALALILKENGYKVSVILTTNKFSEDGLYYYEKCQKENINIDGLPIHIVDTAGLRNHTSDIIEKIGIDKLRGDLYKMVAEIHAGRYPFDNFLW